MADNRQLVDKAEAAERLGTTPRHVEHLADTGVLGHYRVGRYYRFAVDELEQYLSSIHVEASK
jgi:excisionase family DNA binding protein